MLSLPVLIEKVEQNHFVRAIRSGLVKIIPVLMVGAFALIFKSLPIAFYQSFITKFAGGILFQIFSLIYNATFGLLSLYMTVAVSASMVSEVGKNLKNPIGGIISATVAFLISVGFLTEDFKTSSFSAVGMFAAIICGTTAALLYIKFARLFRHKKVYSDGADQAFNRAIRSIFPILGVGVIYALIDFAINKLFGVSNIWQLIVLGFDRLFDHVGGGFWGGLLYIYLCSFLWFFGIHGSDVLESVRTNLFASAMDANVFAVAAGKAPTQIFTKTFFDVFVLIGGCGTLLALLIAMLLFSRRHSNRSLARLAALPMLFNINEIMVFGLPIIYNPVMVVPFLLTPVVAYLVAAGATVLGLVPMTIHTVEWTTPIFLGGWQATGSVAGAVLQLVILIIGVLIYLPFVKLYDKEKEKMALQNISELTNILKESEEHNQNVKLTEYASTPGDVAKQMVNDLKLAMAKDDLYLMYQPQYNQVHQMVGAEALLRWEHPLFGMIYPPLIIKLAEEAHILPDLEKLVYLRAKKDIEQIGIDIHLCVNATVASVKSETFVEFLLREFPEGMAGKARICVEVTEQMELAESAQMNQIFSSLKAHGFHLAIDDFSMGFTSLKYLQENKFDLVKLDGSLVHGLCEGSRSKDIIASIVYLSKSLGFSVLAEFVETTEEQKQLEQIGCNIYQGYLFSKPIPLEELQTRYLADGIHTAKQD